MHGRSNLATRLVSTRAGRTLIATAAWTAIGAVFALPTMSAGAWRQPLLSSLAQWWSWALVTPLIFAVDGRLPFTGKQLARRVAAHGLASVAFTAIYLYVFTAARAAMGIIP